MSSDWHRERRSSRRIAAIALPPANIDETSWDILLELYSVAREDLSIEKLAGLVSVNPSVLAAGLAGLERGQLLTASRDSATGELRPVLTPRGVHLLHQYLSAARGLQDRAVH